MSKSADRMIKILEYVVRASKPTRLTDITRELELDKTTASRYLDVLRDAGYLTRDPDTRRFEIGPGLLSLAAATVKHSNVLSIVRPHIRRVRDLTGETVTLQIRVGDDRVGIDGAESHNHVRRVVPLGERLPLYRGTAAKVILAFLSADEQARFIKMAEAADENMPRLHEHLAFAREHHYLAVVGERSPEVGTLSTPLFGPNSVLGSATVTGPSDRWTQERMDAFAPDFIAIAREASLEIGLGNGRA